MMQSDFLNRLKCDILRCWSWVGKYWHNSSISSSTDWVVVRFLQRNVPVRHIRPNLSMCGKKHGPPHSFIHCPSSLVCLSPSISVCLACWLSSRSSACQQRLFSLTAWQNSQLTQLTASCLQTGLHPLQSALYERPEGRWGRASAASYRCCQQCWSTAVCQLQSIRISLQMSSLTQPGWI